MGYQSMFSDPLTSWVAAVMLVGIVGALLLAADARKRAREGKLRHQARAAHQHKA
jgi:hypothetical protein